MAVRMNTIRRDCKSYFARTYQKPNEVASRAVCFWHYAYLALVTYAAHSSGERFA